MTAHRHAQDLPSHASMRRGQLIDEIYRQMFRLEDDHPGAEIALALALLHAWQIATTNWKKQDELEWLKQICPICISMIEKAIEAHRIARPIDE